MLMLNYEDLRARILGLYGTYRAFSAALGISTCTLSRYLCCKRYIPITMKVRMVDLLHIPEAEVDRYFYRLA